jgi:hypothetical protein
MQLSYSLASAVPPLKTLDVPPGGGQAMPGREEMVITSQATLGGYKKLPCHTNACRGCINELDCLKQLLL